MKLPALRRADPPSKETYHLPIKSICSELILTGFRPESLIRQGRRRKKLFNDALYNSDYIESNVEWIELLMKWRRCGKERVMAYFRYSHGSIEENHEKSQVSRRPGRVLNRALPKCKLEAFRSEPALSVYIFSTATS
jgi:hypothetical protein